jgi:phosphoenolpyruvate carboxykinase (GTP)
VPASQCPAIAAEWDDPQGVPISAILFGGRRATAVPLVTESYDWQHGVYLAANIASETTAAAEAKAGVLRRDPFAMLPFCGYAMGDYFRHWLRIGETGTQLPGIYLVNWFRKSTGGKFLWPGFGDNIRVLKWIFERCDGVAPAQDTPIGRLPTRQALDFAGLNLSDDAISQLLEVDTATWKAEAKLNADDLKALGDVPEQLWAQQKALEQRLG